MGFSQKASGLLLGVFTALAAPQLSAADAPPRPAFSPKSYAEKCVSHFCLAYVRSNSSRLDDTALDGLKVLSRTLKEKTRFQPVDIIALDPDQDDLSLFPFIYWPVPDNAQTLSARAQAKLQNYLDKGGMVLFDVFDP